MKKHSIFKLVCICIVVAVLFTWIFPVTSYSTSYGLAEEARNQVGLFDVFGYASITMSYFGYVAMYLLAIGGFYGVLYKTDRYRNLLDKIVSKFKERELLFISIVSVLLAGITALSGMSFAILFIFPLVISLILLMGFDKITAALVTLGSLSIGIIGGMFSIDNSEAMLSILGLNANYEILTRLMIFITAIVILLFFVFQRCKKNKLKEKDINNILVPSESKDKKKSIWPVVVVIDLVLVILTLGMVSWTSYGIDFFANIHKSVKEVTIAGFPIFEKILGSISELGNWTLTECFCCLIIATILVAIVSRIKFQEFVEGFIYGLKKAFKPALIALFVYTIVFIFVYHPVVLTIYKPILELTKGFNVFTISLVSMLSSILTIDPYYAISSFLPYVVTIITESNTYAIIGIIWQIMYGISVLFAPTGLVLLVILTYLDIPYTKWIKSIWKMLLTLILVFLIIIFVISII